MPITSTLVNYLALQAAQAPDSGLYHGRMGLILALYSHGLIHGDHSLCSYASDVLQNSADNYFDGDISIENGLAGLGLGFTLLYKAGMFKDNLNDLLFEIDKKIMAIDPRKMDDFSFRKGSLGVLYYIRTRLSISQHCVSLHRDYIDELEHNIKRNTSELPIYKHFIDNLKQPTWNIEDYVEKDFGIDNGSAYFLIKKSYDQVFSR